MKASDGSRTQVPLNFEGIFYRLCCKSCELIRGFDFF